MKCVTVKYMEWYHCKGHPVDFMFVLGLVLAEWRVSFEQLVQHAAEAEPVSGRIVAGAFGENFGRHVAVGTTGDK